MKAKVLIQQLRDLDAKGVWAFTTPQLRVIFGGKGGGFFTALGRHLETGLLVKVGRSLYINPTARSRPADVLPHLVPLLRPWEFNYVSFESALHDANLISQIPNRLTVMSTGSSHVFTCEMGTIEFFRCRRNPEQVAEGVIQVPGEPLPRATPERALADLRKARRNVDLVNSAGLQ